MSYQNHSITWYHGISCHLISHCIIAYQFILYPIIYHIIISYHLISYYHVLSCHNISYHIVSHHIICNTIYGSKKARVWEASARRLGDTCQASVSQGGVAAGPLRSPYWLLPFLLVMKNTMKEPMLVCQHWFPIMFWWFLNAGGRSGTLFANVT